MNYKGNQSTQILFQLKKLNEIIKLDTVIRVRISTSLRICVIL
jgi:hypothetical protein